MLGAIVGASVSLTVRAESRPPPCSMPKEAFGRCINGEAVFNVYRDSSGSVERADVVSVEPSDIYADFARCMALHAKRYFPPESNRREGVESTPVSFEIENCPPSDRATAVRDKER